MRFPIIYADPAWPENSTEGTPRSGADKHFKTQTIEEICAQPVKDVATWDAQLYLWVTGRHLLANPGAREVMHAWGFDHVSVAFVWEKTAKDGIRPAPVLGFYTNPNCEFVLLGRRQKQKGVKQPPALRPLRADVKQEIRCPRPGGLASKPEEVRQAIDAMYPHLPKLELNARVTAPGWLCLGDGLDGQRLEDTLVKLRDKSWAQLLSENDSFKRFACTKTDPQLAIDFLISRSDPFADWN